MRRRGRRRRRKSSKSGRGTRTTRVRKVTIVRRRNGDVTVETYEETYEP
jgi:hypothetical protein